MGKGFRETNESKINAFALGGAFTIPDPGRTPTSSIVRQFGTFPSSRLYVRLTETNSAVASHKPTSGGFHDAVPVPSMKPSSSPKHQKH